MMTGALMAHGAPLCLKDLATSIERSWGAPKSALQSFSLLYSTASLSSVPPFV